MYVKSMLTALVPSQPGDKIVNYPTRPLDTTTYFEGTTNLQPSHPVSSGTAVSGGMPGAYVSNRSVPQAMNVVVQRRQPQALQPYNLASQAGMGGGGGINPGGIPMQRGAAQLRRKEPGMGMYPQQK